MHPGLNNIADGVVFACLEAVDGKARGVYAQLNPSEEKLWGWLGTFKAADVMSVAVHQAKTSS
jgi:hypothetical protein